MARTAPGGAPVAARLEQPAADAQPLRLRQHEEAGEEPPVAPQQPGAPAHDPATCLSERATSAAGQLLDDRLGHPEPLPVVTQVVAMSWRDVVLLGYPGLPGRDEVGVERRARNTANSRGQVRLLRAPVGHLDCPLALAHGR